MQGAYERSRAHSSTLRKFRSQYPLPTDRYQVQAVLTVLFLGEFLTQALVHDVVGLQDAGS